MSRKFLPFLLVLALAGLFAGCSSHGPLNGISVDLIKLERVADGKVQATITINNSTVLAFNIGSSKHQVFLNGRAAGTFEIHEPLGLPAQRSMTQTATLDLTGDLPAAGPADYRLESLLMLVLSGDSREKLKLSGTGTVAVP